MSIQELSRTMGSHAEVENLDEDGYTQLDFHYQGITGRRVVLEKGIFSFYLQCSCSHQRKHLCGENLRDL